MKRWCPDLIISRYLISEISKPLAAILAILATLSTSYSAAGFLSEAVNGLVPIDIVSKMIGLKALISLEVLIPISLFLSVVLAFGKLYGDSEFTAMFALRVTPARVTGAVLLLSGALAIVVAGLSLVARPWAYEKLHELSKRAETTLNVAAMEAGTFYVSQHGSRVIFLTHRDGPASPAQDVFVKRLHDGHTEIIRAKRGYEVSPSNDSAILLSDVHIYELSAINELSAEDRDGDRALTAASMFVNPNRYDETPPEYGSVAASSAQLAVSDAPKDVAELQWRLSTPLSTLLLGMLGIPLSRAKPRQSKYEKFGTAILIYSAYYLICTSARTWVQHGVVAAFPGIWWAPATLLAVLFIITFAPGIGIWFRRRRA
jgi:lipopolysaccharide export system permease protein